MSGCADELPMGYGPCIDAAQLVTYFERDGIGSPTLAQAVTRKPPNTDIDSADQVITAHPTFPKEGDTGLHQNDEVGIICELGAIINAILIHSHRQRQRSSVTHQQGTAMPITVRQLTPVFGAEITRVDLTRPLDGATFAEVENAFETYSVLVFPRQNLNDESQIAFSSRFGALETTQGHIANNFTVKQVSVISNLDPEGKLMAADDPRLIYRIGQRNWHSDSSFKKVPAKASLLHARVLPPDGGQTQFASLRAAYDALPEARKREIESMAAIHHYAYSRRNTGIKLTNEEEDQRFPPVPQAMVRSNPVNGRKALYVGSHASHIRELPEEQGRALLAELLEFATREALTYMHHWQIGDLVMYDNRAALHRARPYAITEHARVLHRTTVAGDGPTVH